VSLPLPEDHSRSKSSFGLRATCFVLAAAALVLASMVYQSNKTLNDSSAKLAQAQSDSDNAKNELQQANTKSADLQRQLTAATALSTGLQAQVKTSQVQTTDLQSQLDKAKSQDADLQAQLTAARSHLSDSQAKLTQENEGSVQLRKDLDSAKAQVSDLQSQLDKAQSPQAAAQAPVVAPMPVTTAFERGFWNSAYTLHVKNTNSAPLNVTITINASSRIQPISTTIKAGDTYDVPKLAEGSNIVITSDGFGPVNLSAH
jgi:septal ring factor EnvC (AmiA/AmiB activator)